MFACEHEDVIPDIMIMGKGLTGGYVPLALTLVTEEIFQPFGTVSLRESTLFYGHSYCGNALACSAATASLEVFAAEGVLETLARKISFLASELKAIQSMAHVIDVRQCGFIAGIELRATPAPAAQGRPPDLGASVCNAARRYGLLTRPIRNVIVLMLPFCVSERQLKHAVAAIRSAIIEVYEGTPSTAAET